MSLASPTAIDSNPARASGAVLHKQPAFIVGCVRSGTTLLRLMLDHHPELAFHFEFEFAVDQISADGTLPQLAEYHDYLSQHRVYLLSEGRIDRCLNYEELVNSFLEQKRVRDGKKIVGATVHHHIDRIAHLWPEAKYIHLLRDGRDVARSCSAMGWAGNMYHAVERWIESEGTWEQLRSQIPGDRQVEVRYEDLIESPKTTLTTICQFLGTEFDSAIFDYAKNSTYELPDAQLTQQWRHKLSEREIQLAESRISKMLTERGYELSGLPLITVSLSQRGWLALQNWWWRARFRMRRYGLPLFFTDFVARRLAIGPLARRCKDRINAIDNLHIR